MLNGLDLFSGIGGITIALSEWVRPVSYCEIDRYAQGVLLSRMADGRMPVAPIWDDVSTLNGRELKGKVDIIYGGFPCQPYSTAARGRNRKCWARSEFERLVNEIQPRYVFAENVQKKAFDGFLNESTKRIIRLSASDVGAPHPRVRYWLLAYTDNERKPAMRLNAEMAYKSEAKEGFWSDIEPEGLRVADGVSRRMDRIRALGNAVVPQQAREAFKRLMGLDHENKDSQKEGKEK